MKRGKSQNENSTGIVDSYDISLSSSFIRKEKKKPFLAFFFLQMMKLELSETS